MQQPIIAIIEDNADITTMLNDLLHDAGYIVITYDQGHDAHDFIRRSLPDLIILDWWLEDLNAGGMVLGHLEQDPLTQNVPVIICSAHPQVIQRNAPTLQERGYRVITKPFDPALLLAEIAAILQDRHHA